MGNEASKPQLYTRISKALPPLAPQYGTNDNIDWVDKGTKAFASEGDREQFICKSSQNKDVVTKRPDFQKEIPQEHKPEVQTKNASKKKGKKKAFDDNNR